MFKIGCHLSFSKGYLAMAKEAHSIGANVFQFFTRNPRGGAIKPVDEKDISQFIEYCNNNGISDFLAHAPYTINPCAADENIRNFARSAMKEDIKRLDLLPNAYYNFHPGSHVKQGADVGIIKTAEILNEVIEENQKTIVLIETMSGKGSEIGRNFEEVANLISRVNIKDKIGVCLDTCHVWEAGYDIVNNLDEVIAEFDKIIGLNRLKTIHLNDSKNTIGAHKDRHESIGIGSLGIDTIKSIINHEKLRNLPFYLETPQKDLNGYAEEISLLKGLYEK